MNTKENTACQNVWGVAKATFRRNFMNLNAYIRKEKEGQKPVKKLEKKCN